MHLFVIPAWINGLYFTTVLAITLWRGDLAQKIVGAAVAGPGVYAVLFYFLVGPVTWRGLEAMRNRMGWSDMGVDAVIIVVSAVAAMTGRRYWAVWTTSLGLALLVTDLFHFDHHANLWAVMSGDLIWNYYLGAFVVWGVLARKPMRLSVTKLPAERQSAGAIAAGAIA
jgi:hypothetical protein